MKEEYDFSKGQKNPYASVTDSTMNTPKFVGREGPMLDKCAGCGEYTPFVEDGYCSDCWRKTDAELKRQKRAARTGEEGDGNV